MSGSRIALDQVVFDRDLYPRRQHRNALVDRYRRSLDRLPPITLNRERLLVDGYHRLLAHRLEGAPDIAFEERDIAREAVKRESARINATHGEQLDEAEKKDLARALFEPNGSGAGNIDEIADILSVSARIVRDWTRDMRAEAKAERDQAILDLWFDAHNSQEAIAEKVGCSQRTVSSVVQDLSKNGSSSILAKPDPLHFYDVWRFSGCGDRYGHDYPGRIPGELVEHVLYYYTEPGDVVCDPMSGSGTTLDVCRAMGRRYLAYDLAPVRDEIREHDLTEGFPIAAKGADLIFIDPPYWSMKDEEYATGSMSGLSLDAYRAAVAAIAQAAIETVKPGGYVCWIVQNQTAADIPEGAHYIDHGFEAFRVFSGTGLMPVRRISCPLTTETLQPQAVTKLKESRRMAGLVRDLLVFQRPA